MGEKLTIGILAHVDAGKTTLSESILYLTGVTRKQGRVDHKNAFLDHDEIERNRGITVFAKEARFVLGEKQVTMLDTPDIKADFVELCDPMGPYGNKALGEPPAIPCAPAIRNAVLHATGVAFYENPLTPQRLIDGFKKAGLI